MKKLFSLVLLFGLVLGVSNATLAATPDAPKPGVDFKVLPNPQPVDVPAGKVQVTEFFWYGCPHCAQFEPELEKWEKAQGPDVVFRRVPVAFQERFVPHQKLYHALVQLHKAEPLTEDIFHEIHQNHNYLLTPEAQADFLAKKGVDKKAFLDAYNSFTTASEVKRDEAMSQNYQIEGVPTVTIQGKYETSPSMTGDLDRTLKVMDYLIAEIRAKKM